MKKSPLITPSDRKRYVLKTPRDERILLACKALAKRKLSAEDRRLVRLIKSQLADDWRRPLEKELQKIS